MPSPRRRSAPGATTSRRWAAGGGEAGCRWPSSGWSSWVASSSSTTSECPLDLDLPDFHGRLSSRPEGGLAGHISFEPGRLKMGAAPELPVGTEIDVVVHRGVVDVQGARLVAEKTNLAYHGRIRLAGRPQGQLQPRGAGGPRRSREARLPLRPRPRGGRALERAPLDRRVAAADRRAHGGDGRGLPGRRRPALRELALLRRHAGARPARSRRGRARRLQPAGGRRATDRDPAARPHPGVRARSRRRRAPADDLRLGRDASRDRRHRRGGRELAEREDPTREREDRGRPRGAGGRALPARRPTRLARGGRATDLRARGPARAGDERARERRGGRGGSRPPRGRGGDGGPRGDGDGAHARAPGARKPGGAARGPERQRDDSAARGAAPSTGRSSRAASRARASATPGWTGGARHGRAPWTRLSSRSIRAPSSCARAQGEIRWEGRTEIGWFGLRDGLAGRARASSWPVEDLVKFMEWDVVATGARDRRSGGPRPAERTGRRGEGAWRVAAGTTPSPTTRPARVALEGARRRGHPRRGARRGRLRGLPRQRDRRRRLRRLGGDGRASISARSPRRPLPGVAFGGRLSGRLEMQGTLTRPRLRASLSSTRLFLGDEGIGALEARLVGTGDGRVAVDGSCRSARVDLALAGDGGRPPAVRGRPHPLRALDEPRPLPARGGPPPFSLPRSRSWPPARCACAARSRRRPRSGRRRWSPTSRCSSPTSPSGLASPCGSRSPAAASSSPTSTWPERGPTSPSPAGWTCSARALSPSPPAARRTCARSLSSRGACAARARRASPSRCRAPALAPRVLGTLDLEGAGLRVRGFPHGVEGLQGRVRFTERAAELDGVSGTLAGGRLTLEGQAAYPGGRLTSYDIRPTGRGLALRYPEGLRSLIDAQLRLFGDAGKQWITGTVDVRQALYTKRYDVASELLGARRVLPAPDAASLEEGAQLDLRVRAPGTVRIDNNLADSRRERRPLHPGHDAGPGRDRARGDRARAALLPGTDLRHPEGHPGLRQPPAARPPLRHRGRDPHPLLPGDAARLRHSRARHPHPHLRPAAVVAPDPRPPRRAGRDRGRQPDPDPGPAEPGAARRGGRGHPRRRAALGVGRPRARGRAALRPEPLLDRPLAAARGGHHARPRASPSASGSPPTSTSSTRRTCAAPRSASSPSSTRSPTASRSCSPARTPAPPRPASRRGWAFDVRIRQSR